MKRRPELQPGDVVCLSKKGRREFCSSSVYLRRDTTFIVRRVIGDSSDGFSQIKCDVLRGKYGGSIKFDRRHLWKTGYNVNSKATEKKKTTPQNEISCAQCGKDWRAGEKCYWCGCQN